VLDHFVACFEGSEDPRTGNAGLHDFHELLMIALCAVLCGGRQGVRTGALARHRISTDPPGAVYRVISIDRDAPPPSADTTR
jgi:hypothetical protein